MAVTRTFDPVAEATSAFQLVIKNWMLAVPQLLVLIIALVLALVLGMGSIFAAGGLGAMMGRGDNGAGLAALSGLLGTIWIIALVAGLLGIIAYAATIVAANDAWAGRPIDIAAAIGKGIASIVQLLIFGIIIGIACAILGITIVGPLIIAVLMMYGFQAIVLGGHSGISAIGESYRLVTKNFGPSIIAILAVIVVYIASFVITMVLNFIPIIGQIISLVISALVGAYACTVVTRFYSLVVSGATVASMPAPPSSPPPSSPTPSP
jgi:hypothetical protein